MENLKYIIFSILILSIFTGWYATSTIVKSYETNRLLYNKEKVLLLKNPNLNKWYYQQKEYNIIYTKSLIPFIYKSVDTTTAISTKYYTTENPEYYKD